MPLKLIPGTTAPDTPVERVRRRLRATAEPGVLQCPRCAGREVIEARVGMLTDARGRPSGGRAAWLCVLCLVRGERVVVHQ